MNWIEVLWIIIIIIIIIIISSSSSSSSSIIIPSFFIFFLNLLFLFPFFLLTRVHFVIELRAVNFTHKWIRIELNYYSGFCLIQTVKHIRTGSRAVYVTFWEIFWNGLNYESQLIRGRLITGPPRGRSGSDLTTFDNVVADDVKWLNYDHTPRETKITFEASKIGCVSRSRDNSF
jgi:hypothetical protein